MAFFDKITQQDFNTILYGSGLDIDPVTAYNEAKEHIKASADPKYQCNPNNKVKLLENEWYSSLSTGTPDYSVYGDPYYICDIWACWKMYSRQSVNVLNSTKSMSDGTSVVAEIINQIGEVKTVVDAGCGFAYTTALLKEIFSEATVTGTNLENTWQYGFATKLGKNNGFNIVPEITELKDVDVLFASEYFEHIYEPIAHLKDIIDNCNPKFVITANGFNGDAIGHFDSYIVDEDLASVKKTEALFPGDSLQNIQSAKETSKRFNQYLRDRGYSKLDTSIWNSRPNVWQYNRVKTTGELMNAELFGS